MLQPKHTDGLNGSKDPRSKDWHIAACKRPILDLETHKTKSGGMEKDILCKRNSEESQSCNTYIRQNRLLNKDSYKRQRTLHNDQRINSRRSITTVNVCAANIETSQYIRQMLTDTEGETDSDTLCQQPRRLHTRTSPAGQHRNQTGYILCSQRWRSGIQ